MLNYKFASVVEILNLNIRFLIFRKVAWNFYKFAKKIEC